MEDKKPKRIAIVGGNGASWPQLAKVIKEEMQVVPPDPFENPPMLFVNPRVPEIVPFTEKPRKKRRQHLFKR